MTDPTPTPDAPGTSPSRSPARHAVVLLGVLVPLVPIVVALLISGSAARTPAVSTTQTAPFQPLASSSQTLTAKPATTAIPAGRGALVAYVTYPHALLAAPGGRRLGSLRARTSYGSPTFVPVSVVRDGWLGVITDVAGNNRIGWIRDQGVSLSRDVWRLHAVLSRHTLYVFHNGRVVRTMSIATGKPTAPTPTGHFAVTDRLTTGDPEGPYGCCILALSALAPHHISDWDGGNRIAIHSTPESWSIGYSVSHGCMRLSLANGQWLIDHIPLGTPAVISSA